MNTETLNVEIWNRLRFGKQLAGLPLQVKEGRVDLSGFEPPPPSIIRRYETPLASVVERDESAFVRGASWRNLDFTGGNLEGLRFFDCEIHNCCFDKCDFRKSRLWSTKVRDCTFRKASLRGAVLGAVADGKRNIYSHVDFSGADLRETIYRAAAFEHCLFRATKLVRINFEGSTFTDCLFEGELRDVLFYHRGYDCESLPPNEMINVDFSKATLHDVAFRGLIMDRVKLPHDAEHLVIKNFTSSLDRMIASLDRQPDDFTKKLIAFLAMHRKWAVPDQAQGVINLEDLAEVLGEEGVKRLLAEVPQ